MIWRRRRRGASEETHAARRQLDAARADLESARADDDQVDRVAAQLAELRRRNHFGPMISQALRGSR